MLTALAAASGMASRRTASVLLFVLSGLLQAARAGAVSVFHRAQQWIRHQAREMDTRDVFDVCSLLCLMSAASYIIVYLDYFDINAVIGPAALLERRAIAELVLDQQ